MHRADFESQVAGIAALNEPMRRDLYRLIAARSAPVSRDETAEALGVPRSVAAFHLDKLVEGLLEVELACDEDPYRILDAWWSVGGGISTTRRAEKMKSPGWAAVHAQRRRPR